MKRVLYYRLSAVMFAVAFVAILFQGCGVFNSRRIAEAPLRVSLAEDNRKDGKVSLTVTKKIYSDSDFHQADADLILSAAVSESNGEIMAHGRIAPLTVTAHHNNIAERHGRILLGFDVHVPGDILSKERQVRIVPELCWEGGANALDRLFVTGSLYRQAQNRGYEKYQKYFASIIPDSVDFVKAFGYLGLLEYFTRRNIDGREIGVFGVSESEAMDYYIKHYLVKLNRHRKEKLEDVFRKCVKDPIDRIGIRLDTILKDPSGGLVYRYVQDLKTAGDMHRLKLSFKGSVHTYGKQLYTFSSPDTLTYYVSSLSQLADTSARYIERTLVRDVSVSTMAYIEFERGSWDIDTLLGENLTELHRIKADMDSISASRAFTADSVIITASCSPEGSYAFNVNLAKKRAGSIVDYFSSYVESSGKRLKFRMEYIAENWELLKSYILSDDKVKYKTEVLEVFSEPDYDKRDVLLSECRDYHYIRSVLYPRLRKTDFRFYMHRKVYDTYRSKVEVDAAYREGMKYLQNREYKKALESLKPYGDMNAAIAYLCMDYNASALNILEKLEPTAAAEYLKALAHKRIGNIDVAKKHYVKAVGIEPRMRFRAALDPEMSEFAEVENNF